MARCPPLAQESLTCLRIGCSNACVDMPPPISEIDDSRSSAGGSIPDGEGPAFRLWHDVGVAPPVLIAVPHAGRAYPAALTAAMREPETVKLRLEDRHADALARETARYSHSALLLALAPRALIDLNRSSDDVDWGMVVGARQGGARHSLGNRRARGGLGLVPRRLSGSGEIWRRPLQRAELDARIQQVHRPYHRALGATLEAMRDRWGAALLLDLHSMPPLPARLPDERAAEFVLGDRFGSSCDRRLTAAALGYLGRTGRPAAHNRPYSGGYVLDRHAAPMRGIHALQLEVCRTTYLDARMETPSARLPAVARMLAGLVEQLTDCVIMLGRGDRMLDAAE